MYQWFLSLDFILQLIITFLTGFIFNSFIMIFIIVGKNRKLKAYQRQLEKESITSGEDSARIKVLESKIEVLEKALENALKK